MIHRITALAAAAALVLVPLSALAVEIPTGGTPVRLDITNTTIGAWHLSNGNESACDDNYGEALERLNLSSSWEGWVAGLRIDGSLYYPRPVETPPTVTDVRCREVELRQRYENTLSLEKIWAGWNGRNVEVTLGDSYVSFGRGLSLSLRKTDELGLDTTQRGLRVKLNTDRVAATLVGGFTNINNVDEASGRYDFDPNDGVAGVTADVRIWESLRAGGSVVAYLFAQPVSSIAPPDVDQSYQERWLVGGPKLEAPRLTNWLGVYLEGVGQRRTTVSGETESGYGMYGSATAYFGPATVVFEGKWYGDLAVVQPRFQYIEFDPVQYTQLPTLERVTQPIEHPQRNITGGRVRVDYTITPEIVVYANEAVFRDYEGYLDPETAFLWPGTIHDPYVGVDARIGMHRILGQAGMRFTLLKGQMIRRDAHAEMDVIAALPGTSSLEVHAIHLERSEVLPFGTTEWREGTLQIGYRNRPKFAVGAVLDYTTEPGQPAVWYPGATAEWDFTEASNIRLFAGSSRGGLRCVSGVCRIFPPFTGVKANLTLRY